MALSEFAARRAKPKDKPYKLSDGDGLHLLVNPTGSKLWRLKYRYGGKASTAVQPQHHRHTERVPGATKPRAGSHAPKGARTALPETSAISR